jgi:hypothetical protein
LRAYDVKHCEANVSVNVERSIKRFTCLKTFMTHKKVAKPMTLKAVNYRSRCRLLEIRPVTGKSRLCMDRISLCTPDRDVSSWAT